MVGLDEERSGARSFGWWRRTQNYGQSYCAGIATGTWAAIASIGQEATHPLLGDESRALRELKRQLQETFRSTSADSGLGMRTETSNMLV